MEASSRKKLVNFGVKKFTMLVAANSCTRNFQILLELCQPNLVWRWGEVFSRLLI